MVALAACGATAACLELSGPQSGLGSVTPIALAWPSVVVGDVLRDIAGVEAPLHVEAYDEDGNRVTDATIHFLVLDPGVRVESTSLLRGVDVRDTPARIVAQVRRGDAVLQTPEIRVDVVPRPDSVAPAADTTYDPVSVPPLSTTPVSLAAMTVKVLSRASGSAAGVKSWLVRYEILSEPAGIGLRTARFTDAGNTNATVSFDTTSATGEASRTIAVQAVDPRAGTTQNVRVLVTVGNTRPGNLPTMLFITLPINLQQ